MPYMIGRNYQVDDRNLPDFWDKIGETSFHLRQTAPTLSDIYYRSLVKRILDKWIPIEVGSKILKLDMYNEATWTRYGYHFMCKAIPVYYIDIASSIIRKAVHNIEQSHLSQYSFPIHGDFRSLPFKDESFNVTCSFGSVEHVHQWERCIQEQIRVTKRGGSIIVGVPNLLNIWLRHFFYRLLHMVNVLQKYTNYEIHFQPGFFKEILEDYGLDDVEVRGYHLFPKQLRWLDLWSEQYTTSSLKRYKNRFLKPLLELFFRLEGMDTWLNHLSEMIIGKGIKTEKT